MTDSPASLNYNALVKSYYDNLYQTLRNFRPGPEFLEDWVHDEDHNQSLLGIFEAARNHGLPELRLELDVETASHIDREWLQKSLESSGKLEFESTDNGVNLRFQFTRLTLMHQVHPAYQKELSESLHDLRHQGSLKKQRGLFQASQGGVSLECLVQDGRITDAKHSGGTGVYLPLMDRFCDVITGVPMQEAAEHGVIFLEKWLRNPYVPAPVAGLVTPKNADPIFDRPNLLIRQLFEAYRQGSELQWNDFDRSCSRWWSDLREPERMAKLSGALPEILSELKIPYSGIEILAIKGDTRVVFARNDFSKLPRSGRDLMTIERELKRRIESRLEIVLESLEDKNHRESRTQREPARAMT